MPVQEAAATHVPAMPFVRESRIIRAPRSRVFEAWTDPAILKQWFGAPGMYCPSASLDPRPDGIYRIDVHPLPDTVPASEVAARCAFAEGCFTEVVRDQRLQFTWQPSWNPGEHSLVTVTLQDVPGGTEVTILHERIVSDSAPNYARGWTLCLANLSGVVAP